MKTDEGIFSSSYANIRFNCSGHSPSGRLNETVHVSKSLLLSSSIALVPTSAGLLIALISLHCETSVVSIISATWLATNNCFLRWELCIPYNIVVEPYQKQKSSIRFPWLSVFWIPLPCNSNRGIERCLIAPLCIFQWQKLILLGLLLPVNVDRPMHKFCRQMRQRPVFPSATDASGFFPLFVEVPSIDACLNYNWKLFFPSRELWFFTRLHFIVPMFSFFSQDAFQKSSHVNNERSKQSDAV